MWNDGVTAIIRWKPVIINYSQFYLCIYKPWKPQDMKAVTLFERIDALEIPLCKVDLKSKIKMPFGSTWFISVNNELDSLQQ